LDVSPIVDISVYNNNKIIGEKKKQIDAIRRIFDAILILRIPLYEGHYTHIQKFMYTHTYTTIRLL